MKLSFVNLILRLSQISKCVLLVIYYVYKNKFRMLVEKYRHKQNFFSEFAMKKNPNVFKTICKHVLRVLQCSYATIRI